MLSFQSDLYLRWFYPKHIFWEMWFWLLYLLIYINDFIGYSARWPISSGLDSALLLFFFYNRRGTGKHVLITKEKKAKEWAKDQALRGEKVIGRGKNKMVERQLCKSGCTGLAFRGHQMCFSALLVSSADIF